MRLYLICGRVRVMNSVIERMVAMTDATARRTVVGRMHMGRRLAARRRLLAGEGRPGDIAWASQDPALLLELDAPELGGDVLVVAEGLLHGGWHGTYEELLAVAAAITVRHDETAPDGR